MMRHMGRRSLATERRTQVLEATARCLARHGLAGATLERISQESGMSRSHIRYYVGNRDDLLLAVIEWLHERYDLVMAAQVAAAPDDEKLRTALDYLFGMAFVAPGDDNAVIRELLSAGLDNVAVREAMLAGYRHIQATVEVGLAAEFPGCAPARRRSVAYGLFSLALGNAMMADLDLPVAAGGLARVSAEALLAQLAMELAPQG